MRPLAMKSSGTPGGNASVVRHVGRKTGRPFETPVKAVATDDGFVIALPYGRNTDWLKNVLASGSATILRRRERVPRSIGRRSFRSPSPSPSSRPRTNGPIACSASTSTSCCDASTPRASVSVAAVKAAVLEPIPGELVVDDVQIGTVGPHEVLVRTAAAGLCHSDLHFMEGKYPHPVPAVLGHESAGVVEAVGAHVTYVQPGDHVISCVSGFCGACRYCLVGSPQPLRQSGAGGRSGRPAAARAAATSPSTSSPNLSSFAEQLLVHENLLVKIRPDMPLDKAALIGCGVTTGVGAVMNTAKVRPVRPSR